jgi:hypothetical protein
MSVEEEKPELRIGPNPNVIYPIKVQYCGNCSLPIEVHVFYIILLILKFHP